MHDDKTMSGRPTSRRTRRLGAMALAAVTTVGGLLLAVPQAGAASETVAQWEMNERSGAGWMIDHSGNRRHGSIGDDVTTNTWYQGSRGHRFARHLPRDGAFPGHTTTVRHHRDLNPDAGEFTFTIRYRTGYSFGNIMQKGQGTAAGGYWKFEAPGGSPRCLFRGGNGDSRSGYTNLDLSDNQWHTVTCVRTPRYVEMWVDGVRTSRLWGSTGTISNRAPLSIGGKNYCDGERISCDYFIGQIDHITLTKGS